MQGFRDGMKDLGYQEGRNITQAGLAHSTNALTKTIPIVAVYSGDLDFAAAQARAYELRG